MHEVAIGLREDVGRPHVPSQVVISTFLEWPEKNL
jgi:hypothetical protein